jgi:hypothetical protein
MSGALHLGPFDRPDREQRAIQQQTADHKTSPIFPLSQKLRKMAMSGQVLISPFTYKYSARQTAKHHRLPVETIIPPNAFFVGKNHT